LSNSKLEETNNKLKELNRLEALVGYLVHQIDSEISCYEDLEMTEGVENKFHRGKAEAFKEVLQYVYNNV